MNISSSGTDGDRRDRSSTMLLAEEVLTAGVDIKIDNNYNVNYDENIY